MKSSRLQERLPRWLTGNGFSCHAEDAGDAAGSILEDPLEDPLEEGMVTHSSILALENPLERRAWRAIVYQAACNQTQRKQMSMRAHRLQEKQVSCDVT